MPTYTMRAPDGRTYTIQGPAGATEAQVRAEIIRRNPAAGQAPRPQQKKDDSRLNGFLAGALRPVDNLATWASEIPIIGPAVDNLGQALGFDSTKKAVAKNERARANNTRTGYQMLGEIAGTLPTMTLRGGPLVQGAVGGALLSKDPRNAGGVAKDAALGAVGGFAGDQIGKRVIAPVAERIGRTAPARTLARGVTSAYNKVTGRQRQMLPNPTIVPVEHTMANIVTPNRTLGQRVTGARNAPDFSQARANLADAADMNLPYALADADPRLRTLAGSVTRFSPDARAMAERNFVPRANAQAERAVSGIDDMLAPVTNIEQRGAAIMDQGRNAARPFYDAARARPAPVDDEIAMMLETPAGKSALAKAREIAANEGRDPNGLGFDLNEQGEVVLREMPTFETLQFVKRGLDSVVEGNRNAFGKLELSGDPALQAVNNLRGRFNARLGELNPDYAQGNAAFSAAAKQRDALNLGYEVLPNNALPQRQFDAAVQGLTPETFPEAQRGLSTAMADQVNKQRLSSNPYNAIYGTPNQQAKVATMFPEGSNRFNRLYGLENDMRLTAAETLGGSQTQPRAVADEYFQNGGAQLLGGLAMDTVTGSPMNAAGRVMRWAADRGNLGLLGARQKADTLAPTLLGTSSQESVQFLDDLARRVAEREARREAYSRVGGMFGTPAGMAALTSFGD